MRGAARRLGRTPQFAVAPEALGVAAPATGPGGLVVGLTPAGRPVPLRLFGTEPTRVVATAADAVLVLALRALALDADVRVGTSRPSSWAPLARAISGSPHRLTVVNGPVRAAVTGTPHAPVLVVQDAVGEGRVAVATSRDTGQLPAVPGSGQPAVPVSGPGAWTSRVTVVPAVADIPVGVPLAGADVAILARPDGDPRLLVHALGAPRVAARLLAALAPGEVLLLSRAGEPAVVQVRPTSFERDVLGGRTNPAGASGRPGFVPQPPRPRT